MNWPTLKRQLMREATANPKKVVSLAVLAIVCLYFWAPLVWGWTAGRRSKGGTKVLDTTTMAAEVAQPQPQPSPAEPQEPALDWRAVDRLLDKNPLASSASLSAERRDPFRLESNSAPPPAPAPAPLATPEATVAQLGLTLSSTFFGTHRKVALINGRVLREGQELKVDGHRLRLVEVAPRYVVFQQNGKLMRLSISTESEQPKGTHAGVPDAATVPPLPHNE